MSDSVINFGRTHWVSYLFNGKACIGQIAGGGKAREDGSRSNVLIFTDDEREISVLAVDVFKNVPEPASPDEDADAIPQADVSDPEEEEEASDEEEAEEEEEEEVAALAAAQAEAESEEAESSEEEEEALAAAQAEAEAEAETEAEETDVEEKEEKSSHPSGLESPIVGPDGKLTAKAIQRYKELGANVDSDGETLEPPCGAMAGGFVRVYSKEKEAAEVEATPAKFKLKKKEPPPEDGELKQTPQEKRAYKAKVEVAEEKGEEGEEEEEEEEEPAFEEVVGQEVQGESEGAMQVDVDSTLAPASETAESEQIRRGMDWFAEALVRIDGAETVSADAKEGAKQVVRVFAAVCADRASQNGEVLNMAKSSWLALKQRVNCALTWDLIGAQCGLPPFETPSPPPTPPSSPVRETRKGAMQKASERRETPLSSKKRQKVQKKPPVEVNSQEPEEVELADVDKDEYVVVTTDDTAADILTACKLDDYDNYYQQRKLRNEAKSDDPLLTACEGTSTLQKIRALVRKQVKKFSEAHVCKAARVLYLVLVCDNCAYTDLRSALAYFKTADTLEAMTNLCLLVLNKRTNQPPLIPIVEKMHRMLKAVANVLVSP